MLDAVARREMDEPAEEDDIRPGGNATKADDLHGSVGAPAVANSRFPCLRIHLISLVTRRHRCTAWKRKGKYIERTFLFQSLTGTVYLGIRSIIKIL